MSHPKRRRHIFFAVLGGLALLLVGLILALPMLLEGPITRRAQGAIEDRLQADVAWNDVDLSIVRAFPDLAVTFEGLVLDGTGPWAGERLAEARSMTVRVALPSVFDDGPLAIESFHLDQPVIRLLTTDDGLTNYAISQGGAAGGTTEMDLDAVSIDDGSLLLRDEQAGTLLELGGLELALTAGLREEGARVDASMEADRVTVETGTLRVLDALPLAVTLDGTWGKEEGRLLNLESSLRADALDLRAKGDVRFDGAPTLRLDVQAETPDLAQLLSLVPGVLREDLDALQTGGQVSVSGMIHGPMGDPAIEGRVLVSDGHIQAPGVDEALRSIELDARIATPGGGLDAVRTTIHSLGFTLAGAPFHASGTIERPLSRLDVDLTVQGDLNLGQLAALVPLGPLTGATGLLDVDAKVAGPVRGLDRERLGEVKASGTVALAGVNLPLQGGALQVDQGVLHLADADLRVENLSGRAGASDFRISGRIDDALATLLLDHPIVGSVVLESTTTDLDELLALAREDAPGPATDEALPVEPLSIPRLPSGFDVDVDTRIDTLTFQGLTLTGVVGRASLAERALDLSGLRVGVFGGQATLNGRWDTAPAEPTVAMDAGVDRINVRDAMKQLAWLDDVAPIAESSDGVVSAQLRLDGRVDGNGALAVDSLEGRGGVQVHELRLAGSETMALVADALSFARFEDFVLDGASLEGRVNDGRVTLTPFRFEVGPIGVLASGSHGLDNTLAYELRMNVPASWLLSEAESRIESLLANTPFSRTQLDLGDTVEVVARVGGTVQQPRVSLAVDELIKGVGQVVKKQVEEVVDTALADARARADALLAEAQARADAARDAAVQAAEVTRDRLYTLADAGVAEAKSPVATLAAKAAAEAAKGKADDAFDKALAKANERYEQSMEDARSRADSLLTAARSDVPPTN